MIALFRQTILLLFWGSCAAAMGQGYLPLVGPPPLRFELPLPAPIAEPVILPPLSIIEPRPSPDPAAPAISIPLPGLTPEPELSTESTASTTNVARIDLLPVPVWPISLDSSATTNNPGAGIPSIGSQMFFKYFSGQPGTNSNGVSIFGPVGFVPPMPVLPSSSSAVFEVVPATKP